MEAAMASESRTTPPGFDELIETRAFSRLQGIVVALVSAILILDGLNLQLLAFSVPSILADWRISKIALAPAVGMTMVGMMAGALLGGALGDRIGRRPALIVTISLFTAMTLGCATAGSVAQLAALRLLSGLGFGACFPNATALVAEWVPKRRVGLAVGLTSVGVPLGGMAGALVTLAVLPHGGWRGCFVAGGILAGGIGLLALAFLPESPAWLSTRGASRHASLERLAARAWSVAEVGASSVDQAGGIAATAIRYRLLGRNNLRVNVGLWLAFFMNMMVANAILAWGTTALSQLRLDLTVALGVAVPYNIASMGMTLLAALLSVRVGSRVLLIGLGVAGAAACMEAALLSQGVVSHTVAPGWLLIGYIVVGGAMGGIQALLFALAAHAYPTQCRARGVGASSALGRLGGIVSGFGGGLALSQGSTAPFFTICGGGLLLVAVGAAVVDRHIRAS